MIHTLRTVLSSWIAAYARFLREAVIFGYRLATNKVGLPRFLWLAMLLSWAVIIVAYLVTGK